MKELPILFNGQMVRAVLDRTKTQTRRVIKGIDTSMRYVGMVDDRAVFDGGAESPMVCEVRCPYGAHGTQLWVRESGKITGKGYTGENGERWSYGDGCWKYKEDGVLRNTNHIAFGPNWKSTPSIHMPRWASRITLEVVSVRVERVQDIRGYSDLKAEGCLPKRICGGERDALIRDYWIPLWDSINAKRGFGWGVNPWVWVVEFKVVTP